MPRHKRRVGKYVLPTFVMGQEPTPEGGTPVPPTTPENPSAVEPLEAPPAPSPEPTAEPKVFDEAYVKGLRTENANWRIKSKELQDKVDALEREKLSEVDALKLDVTKYKDDIVPTLTRDVQTLRVQVEAAKLGIVDPEAASLLLDWKSINDGTPISDALLNLVEARPWLKQAAGQPPVPPAPTPPVTPPKPPTQSNPAVPPAPGARTYTKGELERMSQAEMAPILPDVLLAMKEGRVDMTR